MDEPVKLIVDGLQLSYGAVEVLKGISLELRRGEVLALLGPSGSGKTTLLRAIAGLERPNAGSVAIDGKPVFEGARNFELPVEKRDLGMVFQSYALWPHRTVFQNVAFGMRVRGRSKTQTETDVQAALDQLGLGHLRDRYPHELSGGQQQRVAIARALVYSPPVILMDEPLSNLDANLREEAKIWLRSMITQMNLSAIIVTHDQQEAMAIGDRIIFLSGGRIEQAGTPVEIYNQPESYVTAEFFGRNNRISGRCTAVSDGYATIEGGYGRLRGVAKRRLSPGDDCSAVLRIERLKLAAEAGAENALQGRHVTSMYAGSHWEHVFQCGDLLVSAQSAAPLNGGDHLLAADPADLWIYSAAT